jgi:parallel beta-helix repeat protein
LKVILAILLVFYLTSTLPCTPAKGQNPALDNTLVVCVGAHPEDIDIGMSGALYKDDIGKHPIMWLVVTDGGADLDEYNYESNASQGWIAQDGQFNVTWEAPDGTNITRAFYSADLAKKRCGGSFEGLNWTDGAASHNSTFGVAYDWRTRVSGFVDAAIEKIQMGYLKLSNPAKRLAYPDAGLAQASIVFRDSIATNLANEINKSVESNWYRKSLVKIYSHAPEEVCTNASEHPDHQVVGNAVRKAIELLLTTYGFDQIEAKWFTVCDPIDPKEGYVRVDEDISLQQTQKSELAKSCWETETLYLRHVNYAWTDFPVDPGTYEWSIVHSYVGGSIYIRADGSVDPRSAPILNVGNVYYNFAADVSDSLVIERSNIVVDGAGHMLEGAGTGNGISITGENNVTISNLRIKKFYTGIKISNSYLTSISENCITKNINGGIDITSASTISVYANNITDNEYGGIDFYSVHTSSVYANNVSNNNGGGIYIMYYSHDNSVYGNIIANNTADGVALTYSDYNSVYANCIANNTSGINIYGGLNYVYHNCFVNNTIQATQKYASTNWDAGYPSGGNYWSDYSGVDLYRGLYQNETGGDGIGDTPYVIDADNRDNYPLMEPWTPVTGVESLVVRGLDNRIYYRAYNVTTASWASWNALPGLTCDSPAATVCGNELHIVVRSIDGYLLWHGYVSLISNAFSGWTLLSGSTPSAPTLTANSTHVCLVVRGQTNLIYYRFYSSASRTWTGWTALPSGITCDGPAAAILGNKLHVVVRGMDGYTIWHSSFDLSTGPWLRFSWDLIGGATESKPTLATCESRNEIYLVVRGLDNVIYRNTWSGSGWAGWVGLPTGATCDGVGATVFGEKLHVVVRGMDGYTLWHGSIDLAASTFSGWTLLDGSTLSTPTLTS